MPLVEDPTSVLYAPGLGPPKTIFRSKHRSMLHILDGTLAAKKVAGRACPRAHATPRRTHTHSEHTSTPDIVSSGVSDRMS